MTTSDAAVPHYRRRALAGLDELIARAEAVRVRWQAGGAGRAAVMLGLANERLSMLRTSRLALLAADEAGAKGGGRR
jgi:hypothetical protein